MFRFKVSNKWDAYTLTLHSITRRANVWIVKWKRGKISEFGANSNKNG